MPVDIKANIEQIRQDILECCSKYSQNAGSIELCAVSKTKPLEDIELAAKQGVRIFGENYVQEICAKFGKNKSFLSQIDLHLIGHLQSNKIAKILPFVKSIDSVDSLELLKKLHNAALKNFQNINVMFEVNSSGDESKTGFKNIDELCKSLDFVSESKCLKFTGMMTMGPLNANDTEIHKCFESFMNIYQKCSQKYTNLNFKYKSFGMTGDYKIALEMGSNFLRIGSGIFGERVYA